MLASRTIGLQAVRAFQPIRFAAPVTRQARFLNMRATPRMMRPVPVRCIASCIC